MAEPSTDWREVVDDAETTRHQRFVEQLVGIQSDVDRTAGPGRAFHRKQVLGLRAELEVRSDLPEHARHGLFARPGSYRGFARLSNGGVRPAADAVPDVRGLALSFRGIEGPGALGRPTDRQDFVLINRPVFGFQDSQPFTTIVPALAEGKTAFLKAMVECFGVTRAPIEAARLGRDLLRPFSGFATEPFFSAAPVRWGPFAAKVRVDPHQTDRSATAPLDYARDMAGRLSRGAVTFDLQAQFFVSEEVTPIENGLVDWPQDVAEFLTVGEVRLPGQDPTSPEGRSLAEQVERDRFDPWAALAEHRPLGEIMRARRVAYFPSQKHRGATGT